MIVGNGMLAQACQPAFGADPAVTLFASGVSNSRETRPEAFARESALLDESLDRGGLLVYFSTCSIADYELSTSPYVRHKLAMEKRIAERAERMAIFRLPQVVGHTPNPHTLTNYLHHQIDSGAPFQVWSHARRNLIDVADVAVIARRLVDEGAVLDRITNIACPFSVPVIELVRSFEAHLGRRANFTVVDAGASYPIDVTAAMAAAGRAGVAIGPDYIDQLIRKYYDHRS